MKNVITGGQLYFSGGFDGDYNCRDEIIVWLDKDQEWLQVGKMKKARVNHAMSTIQLEDEAMEYCR